jgi:hypothetical protein
LKGEPRLSFLHRRPDFDSADVVGAGRKSTTSEKGLIDQTTLKRVGDQSSQKISPAPGVISAGRMIVGVTTIRTPFSVAAEALLDAAA